MLELGSLNKYINVYVVKMLFKRLYIYFIVLFASTIATIIFSVVTIGKITATQNEADSTKQKIQELTQKIKKISSNTKDTLSQSQEQIDSFLPNELDLFSTIAFLDALQRRTNFRVETIILSNNEVVNGQTQEKNINILGDITFQQFLDFLKKYKTVTGRLLSVKNVNITTLENDTIQLNAQIYAYNPVINIDTLEIDNLSDTDRKILKEILDAAYPTSKTKNNISDSYKSKKNPFLP